MQTVRAGVLSVFREESLLLTASVVMFIVSIGVPVNWVVGSGISAVSSSVNMLLKKALRSLAFPVSSLTVRPESSTRSSSLALVRSLVFEYLQNAFGLDFTFLASFSSKSRLSLLVRARNWFLHWVYLQ